MPSAFKKVTDQRFQPACMYICNLNNKQNGHESNMSEPKLLEKEIPGAITAL